MAERGYDLKELFELLSPVMINPGERSITIVLSRRFLLFELLRQLKKRVEKDPYLNFISTLKYYKVLGKFLHGSLKELYHDRNKPYFRDFFIDHELYKIIKSDLEWVYDKCNTLRLTITKRGVLLYDNYKKNQFNTLLLTIHSGVWMPPNIQKKQLITRKERLLEEDIDTHKLYCPLVLKKGGIWIDNKMSRFACDFNRPRERAIYDNNQETWIDDVWKEELSQREREWLQQGYDEFYFTLRKLISTHRFNIIFDGHSMKEALSRPAISFGTKFIPSFYLPIVEAMLHKMEKHYTPALLNTPYSGGYILEWLSEKFSDIFICSMEVNKRLYMSRDRTKVDTQKRDKIAEHIEEMFTI